MYNSLTQIEKELLNLLIQGQNFNGISLWLEIDYVCYKKLKQSLFKKLKVTRTTQLLATLLKICDTWDDL